MSQLETDNKGPEEKNQGNRQDENILWLLVVNIISALKCCLDM